MKKVFLIILLSYFYSSEAQNYNSNFYYGSNYNDMSYWYVQPQQPVFNYQFNTNHIHGNSCVSYDNMVARELGRTLGNLIVTIQRNKRLKRQRKRYRNNRHNINCSLNNRAQCCR